MRAAVFFGQGDMRMVDWAEPKPAPTDVVIRVGACGICGTDRHILHGEFPARPPVILGHEYAGEVVAVGEEVTDLSPGMRVVVDPNIVCGVCRPCRRGQVHMCRHLRALGVDRDGGFAEFSLVPRSQCYLLPEGVSLLEGAMAEPVACCLHGIDLAGIKPGDRVAVIGGGAIGLILAQLARLRGAGLVLLSDPIAARREMALRLGVDAVVDPTREDPTQPGGLLEEGADIVIEAVGAAHTAAQAVAWAAPGGIVLWFGVAPPEATVAIRPNQVFEKELTIRGARINPFTHERALALLASGRLDVLSLITRQAPLDDLPRLLADGADHHIKTVIIP